MSIHVSESTTVDADAAINPNAERVDDSGRRIYHMITTSDLKELGVSLTLCGRLMFKDDGAMIGRSRRDRRDWIMCPMCAAEYEKIMNEPFIL